MSTALSFHEVIRRCWAKHAEASNKAQQPVASARRRYFKWMLGLIFLANPLVRPLVTFEVLNSSPVVSILLMNSS